MKDALKGYLALATGLSEVTRQRAVGAAKALVAQGEATAGQVSSLADDLLVQSRSNREAVTALVKYEVDRALGRVGLASNDEVGELTARVRALEGSVREVHRDLAAAGHGDSAAPAAAAKRPTTAPARQAAAKRATTAPAKKLATTTAATKATAVKRAPATKAPTRTARATGPAPAAAGKVRAAPGKAAAARNAPAAIRGAKARTSPATTVKANRGA